MTCNIDCIQKALVVFVMNLQLVVFRKGLVVFVMDLQLVLFRKNLVVFVLDLQLVIFRQDLVVFRNKHFKNLGNQLPKIFIGMVLSEQNFENIK